MPGTKIGPITLTLSLIRSKLNRPWPGAKFIPRPQLLAQIDCGLDCKLAQPEPARHQMQIQGNIGAPWVEHLGALYDEGFPRFSVRFGASPGKSAVKVKSQFWPKNAP